MEFQKIPMNKYQTELTEELVNSLPQEVQDQLFDIINNVEFVKRLISPTREYAKDRPRDDRGRIIVDLANPHILEDMDYFRPSAIHYEKYGTFTNLRPNANPNSEYGKWVREERRRIWDGYVRESDGEWVTGYMYWFLNYSPMMLSKIREYKDKNGDSISYKFKTTGKMVDDYITPEGKFDIILFGKVGYDAENKRPIKHFVKEFDGEYPAKDSLGALDDLPDEIPNDLSIVVDKLREIYG